MSSASINKGLIIYRGANSSLDRRSKALKYGLHLNSIHYVYYSSKDKKRCMRVIRSQGRKRTPLSIFNYRFEYNQNHLVRDIERISGTRKFMLNFHVDCDYSFFKSEASLDSQYTVLSVGEYESENELDLEIQSQSKIIQQNKRTLKKIFKQAKRVSHFTLTFEKMDSNHDLAFRYLPMLNQLEDFSIKIRIRDPSDIVALRDLLSQAKRRNSFPNMKSMVIKLRHSYNKEYCSQKFSRFCKILQEIAGITQDLPWIRFQLKVKYMWRLDEDAIIALQETLEKVQNKMIKLSLVTGKVHRLEPLFKPISSMKNLEKFAIRFDKLSDPLHGPILIDILKKLPSLRRLEVQGKNILKAKDQKRTIAAEKLLQSFDGFDQVTSFSFKEKSHFIEKAPWSSLTNSIFKFPQLQVLILEAKPFGGGEVTPDLEGFLDFFERLKTLRNLREFTFQIYYPNHLQKIHGSEIFFTFCEALRNFKELRKLRFGYPWISSMNSDLQELTKVLPNLQKLEHFYFEFARLKSIKSVENNVFLEFCKGIRCLKVIEHFCVNLEMHNFDDLEYEAALLPLRHLEQMKASWRMSLEAWYVAERVKSKLIELTTKISIWKKEGPDH